MTQIIKYNNYHLDYIYLQSLIEIYTKIIIEIINTSLLEKNNRLLNSEVAIN